MSLFEIASNDAEELKFEISRLRHALTLAHEAAFTEKGYPTFQSDQVREYTDSVLRQIKVKGKTGSIYDGTHPRSETESSEDEQIDSQNILAIEGILAGLRPGYAREAVYRALNLIVRYGGISGDAHKAWVLDQVTRMLTVEAYEEFVVWAKAGEDGPDTGDWDEGVCP